MNQCDPVVARDVWTTPFTIVTTVKGRLFQLQKTLPSMLNQNASKVVIVDYGCPEESGSWARKHYPTATIVRVEATDFHASAARNAGAAAATTSWICFVDVDIELSSYFLLTMSKNATSGNFYISKNRHNGMAGFLICEIEAFRRVGGYDEQIRNVGREDTDMIWSLLKIGVKGVWLSGKIGIHHPHSAESRVRYHTVKNIAESYRINDAYLKAKWGGVFYPTGGWQEVQIDTAFEK